MLRAHWTRKYIGRQYWNSKRSWKNREMFRKITLYKRQGQLQLLKATQVWDAEQVAGSSLEKLQGLSQITSNSFKPLLKGKRCTETTDESTPFQTCEVILPLFSILVNPKSVSLQHRTFRNKQRNWREVRGVEWDWLVI